VKDWEEEEVVVEEEEEEEGEDEEEEDDPVAAFLSPPTLPTKRSAGSEKRLQMGCKLVRRRAR
jgi:hypothetical protein